MLADTITFNKQWSLLLGGNYATIQDKSHGSGISQPANNTGALTPSAALMFKPVPAVTTYVSYIEGLSEGETAPVGTANANQVLSPYVSNQVELGVKTSLSKINLNCALFRIDKAFAYTDPSDNVFKANGRQVNMGCEVTFSGKITNDLTLAGGFTLLNAKIEDTASGDPSSGKVPDAVPRQIARLYAEYAVPFLPGFTLTGGINYTGREYVDSANTNSMSIPSVITGDVGARYKCKIRGSDVTFRVNVNNVTDKAYWTTWQGGRVYVGDPRTVSCSAEIAWF
jgi:iron complex outermembrane receptor protein